MKFNLFGVEIDVEIPADPIAFIKEKVIIILNYMGYEWPVTDTGVLDAWAAQWDGLAGQLQAYVTDLQSGISHLVASNEGAVIDQVAGYMGGGDSNLHSLQSIATAAPLAATAYRGASILVTALRAYVIGQIILDAVSIAAAIISGGASAAVSFLAKKGATLLINMAIDQAINDLMGG